MMLHERNPLGVRFRARDVVRVIVTHSFEVAKKLALHVKRLKLLPLAKALKGSLQLPVLTLLPPVQPTAFKMRVNIVPRL